MQTIFTLKQQVLNGEVITVPVQNSSNISIYSYNPQTKIFSVLFKRGTLYKYSDVGLEVAFKFLNTSMVGGSIGELFRSEYNQNISSANGDFIGANMNEAIIYFNNPNNADVKAAYEKKLNLI